jgi:hypothetical protein
MTRLKTAARRVLRGAWRGRWLTPWLLLATLLAVGIYAFGLQTARVDALAAALSDEQSAAEDRGESPVAPAPGDLLDDPEAQGPKGDTGDTGATGPQGKNGTGVDSLLCVEDVWIVTYSDGRVSNAGDGCAGGVGPKGDTGDDGKPGTNGTDGAAGPAGPTGPSGPPGADGTDGQDGADGRSITNAECIADTGRWRITYSDGDVDDDAGPCLDPLLG